jgi:hypothetical protein
MRMPLLPSLLNLPFPRPPARTWAFITDGPSGGMLGLGRMGWKGEVCGLTDLGDNILRLLWGCN